MFPVHTNKGQSHKNEGKEYIFKNEGKEYNFQKRRKRIHFQKRRAVGITMRCPSPRDQ